MSVANLTFKQRFLVIGFVGLLGFAAVVWVNAATISRVKVTGGLYHGIVEDKALSSDLTQPSMTLFDPFVAAHEAITDSPEERAANLRLAESGLATFRDRQKYWETRFVDRGQGTREQLFVHSKAAAEEVMQGLERDVFPALRAVPFDRPKAQAAYNALTPAFARHKKAVNEAVAILQRRMDISEKAAVDEVERGERTALLVALGSVILCLAIGIWLLRSVLASVYAVRDRMQQMADGDADLGARIVVTSKDEVGQLASALNRFLDKIAGLVRAVKKSTIQLRSTATEMAATSHQQQTTVSSFGAATTQVAAATKEISATGAELTTTMAEVDRVAKESAAVATGGRDSLAAMRDTMGSLASSSAKVSERLSAINDKARDITGVVTTITKVADQTNLLSVNAAIEAEKAGEYGRGFLVVAREIRRLADQTAAATLDIEQTVRHMQGAVSTGVMEMDKFTEQVRRSVAEVEGVSGRLDQIIEQVQVLTGRFAQVSDGMKMQAQGASQISEAVGALSGNVNQTSRSLAEFTAAAEEMKSAIEGLKQELAKFKMEE